MPTGSELSPEMKSERDILSGLLSCFWRCCPKVTIVCQCIFSKTCCFLFQLPINCFVCPSKLLQSFTGDPHRNFSLKVGNAPRVGHISLESSVAFWHIWRSSA